MEEILTESESKLDGVRQKILQVAQELSGEDMHQFHRAVTTGEPKTAHAQCQLVAATPACVCAPVCLLWPMCRGKRTTWEPVFSFYHVGLSD